MSNDEGSSQNGGGSGWSTSIVLKGIYVRYTKNQSRKPPSPEASSNSSGSDYSDSETLDLAELDSLAYLEMNSDHSDNDNEVDWDEVANEEFQDRCLGDDHWVPTRQAYTAKWVAEKRKPGGCPAEYIKGPDSASKSLHTQQRYAKYNRAQTKLDSFFSAPSSSALSAPSSPVLHEEELNISEDEAPPSTETAGSTPFSTAPPSHAPSPPQIIPQICSASVLSDPTDGQLEASLLLIQVDNSDEKLEEDDSNDWDAVVDDIVGSEEISSTAPAGSPLFSNPAPGVIICSWHALRKKIKGGPKKGNLLLSQHNQLLIIRNFATLCIKGLK
ncbi:hypothetical protein DFH08DRAFT_826049 [Mycena albidolilacea]|uniref:Uncharacterized protein n=1 Tax=Mycena albidolilacea TaxID=1033008 RepID=A0AAD7E9K9_9AGAR|nr:hypothetical protein DFH08DRAFT_826049 [Mycena albidolilacea]